MLKISSNPDVNYLAQIVKLEQVSKHPNADKLQLVRVCGAEVVTGLDAKVGDYYCYFPIECQIDSRFLSWTNSYSDAEKNYDVKKKGFFPKNSRVKAVKLRDIYSNGYIVPISELEKFIKEFYNKKVDLSAFLDTSFDSIEEDRFVKKFVRTVNTPQVAKTRSKGKVKKYETKLVEGQFAFHDDTLNIRRNLSKIRPDDVILISEKIHGSSWIVSKVLVKKKLSLLERLAKFLGFNPVETEYGNLFASRTVIKNKHIDKSPNQGFYDVDIWQIVSNEVYPLLDAGVTLYGEVYGFTPSGKAIQPQYDYGCPANTLDFIVYKGTITLPDGKVYVMSYPQLKAYCDERGLKMAQTHYYGLAKDLFPELNVETHWADNFLRKLEETYLEKKCSICKNDVWAEGICISKQIPFVWDCLKLKSNNFLGYESKMLDGEELSVEEMESNSIQETP